MYFEYPIDAKTLLRKKRQIKRQLLERNTSLIDKKIAILGGSTTDEIAEQLELFLLNYGIKVEIYQSEYGKYIEDALFGNPRLDAFSPDVVYFHTNWRNVTKWPTAKMSEDEISDMLENEFSRFVGAWENIEKRFGCLIIQNNFDRPNYRLLGNKDISDVHGRTNYIMRLNQKIYEYSQKHKNIYINDLDYLASEFGLSAWADPLYWYMYKYAMCLEAIPYVADSISKIIKAIYGKNKKVLTLDLDNTLWGGIVGDEGIEGISIGSDTSNAQVYLDFQRYCKAQKSIGVVLAVDSKNDYQNAIAGLNHPDGVLKPEDFVSIKANWKSKDENLIQIADELSLGTDSFVFLDDNPAEREIVRKQVPGVSVPEVGKIEHFIKTLDHSGFFEVVSLSFEDIHKTEMYHAKAAAIKTAATFSDYGEYLDSLEMSAIIRPFEDMYLQRIVQLINKSNQFNLTTLRYSEDDIHKMMNSNTYITLYGKLTDKFGDNGVVTVVAGEIINSELHIRLWLMSCRVLKRSMEDAMMDKLMETVKAHGIETVYGYYYPTNKNGMVKSFYNDMNFVLQKEEDGSTVWKMKTKEYINKSKHIAFVEVNQD